MISTHINLAQLRTLTGNDSAFIIEILELIQSHSPDALAQMTDQLQNGEFDALSAAAHKFKSSINMLGNAELINLMKDIEMTAKVPEQRQQLAVMMDEFRQVCDQLLIGIQMELSQLRGVPSAQA